MINTNTSWQLAVKTNTITLDQHKHLNEIIDLYQPVRIVNYNNFDQWNRYATTESNSCDLLLYAHTTWSTLNDIVDDLKNFNTNLIFLAVNKYLLLPDLVDNSLPEDYNQAIKTKLTELLVDYTIIDYQYHVEENGNVGNFVVPDNRFLLACINQ